MTFLALCGSLRSVSSNLWVLRATRELLPFAEVEIYEGMGALPHFNPELDGEEVLPAVSELRAKVSAADGLIISCPEYAHGVPGSFKNLLDWLVSTTDFPGKRVLLLNASPHSHHAQDSLAETLRTMSAVLVYPPYLTLPLHGRPDSVQFLLDSPEVAQGLESALAELVKQVNCTLHE